MSVRINPPFKVVLNLSQEEILDLNEISLRRLRNVVIGRDDSFSRVQAMSLLIASDFPNKHRDFEAVLQNDGESSRLRYLAALKLGEINTPLAIEILINSLGIRNERVLAGIMTALGRIGDKSALETILKIINNTTGFAALRAKFAAALISHRLGLKGNDLPVPEEGDYLKLSENAGRPFQTFRPNENDIEICLLSLALQPFGIELSDQNTYQIRCRKNVWMLLLNRSFASQNAVEKLQKTKAFLGVIASVDETKGTYSTAYLLLTSPVKESNSFNIFVPCPNGDLIFGGTAQVRANRAEFSIRSISRPGAFPVQVEGVFEDGKLELQTALSGLFVQNQRQPIRILDLDVVE